MSNTHNHPSVQQANRQARANKADIVAIELKTDYITVTEAIDLDSISGKTDYITVSEAIDLDNVSESVRTFIEKTADYTALTSDDIILVDTSSGGVTITLPDATKTESLGQQLVIKSVDATNTVTIDGHSAQTIDGSATLEISTLYEAKTLACNGTEWLVI
jgi:hypothetical protein